MKRVILSIAVVFLLCAALLWWRSSPEHGVERPVRSDAPPVQITRPTKAVRLASPALPLPNAVDSDAYSEADQDGKPRDPRDCLRPDALHDPKNPHRDFCLSLWSADAPKPSR